MSIRTARQAACLDILTEWIEPADALRLVIECEPLFESQAVNAGTLVRRIVGSSNGIPKGVFFSSLSRTLRAIDRHADYFATVNYPPDISRQVAAHEAFRIVATSLLGNQPKRLEAIARQRTAVRRMPEFMASAVEETLAHDVFELPLVVSPDELGWIIEKIYAHLCRESGPSEADRRVSRALELSAQRAPGYDARNFL
jgi:hypothetical protein